MEDAHRGVDAAGNIVDFHSDLLLRRGDEVVRCTATVNDPCSAFGYRFHQAAFFDDLAQLTIWGPDGRVLFDDVLDFENESTATPALTVTERGRGGGVRPGAAAAGERAGARRWGTRASSRSSELALPGAVYGVSWRPEGETLVASASTVHGIQARSSCCPGEMVDTPHAPRRRSGG